MPAQRRDGPGEAGGAPERCRPRCFRPRFGVARDAGRRPRCGPRRGPGVGRGDARRAWPSGLRSMGRAGRRPGDPLGIGVTHRARRIGRAGLVGPDGPAKPGHAGGRSYEPPGPGSNSRPARGPGVPVAPATPPVGRSGTPDTNANAWPRRDGDRPPRMRAGALRAGRAPTDEAAAATGGRRPPRLAVFGREGALERHGDHRDAAGGAPAHRPGPAALAGMQAAGAAGRQAHNAAQGRRRIGRFPHRSQKRSSVRSADEAGRRRVIGPTAPVGSTGRSWSRSTDGPGSASPAPLATRPDAPCTAPPYSIGAGLRGGSVRPAGRRPGPATPRSVAPPAARAWPRSSCRSGRGRRPGLGRLQVERPQRRHERGRGRDHAEGQDPAADDARDRPEEPGREAALERAQLVRRADEDPVHGRDPAADPLRRQDPQDGAPDDHAHAVGHAG